MRVEPYTTDPGNPRLRLQLLLERVLEPDDAGGRAERERGRVLPLVEQPEWWVLFSRRWDADFPVTRGWGNALNFHTVAGDKGWHGATSSVHLDYTDGRGVLWVARGGRYDASIDNWRNVDTISFPVPVRLGTWQDYVLHVRWSYGTTGLVELWVDGRKVVEYRGLVGYGSGESPSEWERYAQLWQGFYRPGYPREPNTAVASFEDVANRVGTTYEAAVADRPRASRSWGSVPPADPVPEARASSQTELAATTHTSFAYPEAP